MLYSSTMIEAMAGPYEESVEGAAAIAVASWALKKSAACFLERAAPRYRQPENRGAYQ